jgi:hypothetical protein
MFSARWIEVGACLSIDQARMSNTQTKEMMDIHFLRTGLFWVGEIEWPPENSTKGRGLLPEEDVFLQYSRESLT